MQPAWDTPLVSRSVEDTHRVAEWLVAHLPRKALVTLHGDLGSGKTAFVQGMAECLAIRVPVTSPSFALINEYAGTRALHHIDLYRLNTSDEALAIGLEDYLDSDGITAIEWAERAADVLREWERIQVSVEALGSRGHRRILLRRRAAGED